MNRQNVRALEKAIVKKNMTKKERREYSHLPKEIKRLVKEEMINRLIKERE